MSQCPHDSGGNCINCNESCNSCCGDAYYCDICGYYMCADCYINYNHNCGCCSGDIVTDSQILRYLFKHAKINNKSIVRSDIETRIKKKIKNKQKSSSDSILSKKK